MNVDRIRHTVYVESTQPLQGLGPCICFWPMACWAVNSVRSPIEVEGIWICLVAVVLACLTCTCVSKKGKGKRESERERERARESESERCCTADLLLFRMVKNASLAHPSLRNSLRIPIGPTGALPPSSRSGEVSAGEGEGLSMMSPSGERVKGSWARFSDDVKESMAISAMTKSLITASINWIFSALLRISSSEGSRAGLMVALDAFGVWIF